MLRPYRYFAYINHTKAHFPSLGGIVSLMQNEVNLSGNVNRESGLGKASGGLHTQVVELLGIAVCNQDFATGSIMKIENLEQTYGVSRSVVREAVRVLESKGMVSSRRRVGIQVMAPSSWNLFDPQVIRWRLATRSRIIQLRAISEFRMAIEPEAARLASTRAPLKDASALMGLAGRLWAAGEAGDQDAFLKLDIEFHSLVLSSSGNEMFAKLDSLVSEILTGRTKSGLMPAHPHYEALQLHVDVATAIQRGDQDVAKNSMLRIMERTIEEMNSMWESPHQSGEFIKKSDDAQ